MKCRFLYLFAAAALTTEAARGDPAFDNFIARCATPGVTVCEGFDYTTPEEYNEHIWAYARGKMGLIDNATTASGSGSLGFTIRADDPDGTEGGWRRRFSKVPGLSANDQQQNDPANQFGPGDEFFIQWRQRFDSNFLNDPDVHINGGGQKMVMVDGGDLPGCQDYPNDRPENCAASCTEKEVVVQNTLHRGLPHVYHSCGSKDGKYEPLETYDSNLGNIVVQNEVGCLYPEFASPPCKMLEPDQWMTFELHVKVGTLYNNDGNYKHDSTVRLYVASEGEEPVLVLDYSPQPAPDQCHLANTDSSLPSCKTGYDLVNMPEEIRGTNWNGSGLYGRVFLIPLDYGKTPSSASVVAHTWYDELIVSTAFIPFPGDVTGGGNNLPSPANLDIR